MYHCVRACGHLGSQRGYCYDTSKETATGEREERRRKRRGGEGRGGDGGGRRGGATDGAGLGTIKRSDMHGRR